MKPVNSTAEILALKALNRNINKIWIDWAVEMLMAGFDTENLAILAGEFEPYNQFQLQHLTTKILEELHLDYSDIDRTIKNYACYLIDEALNGRLDNFKVLDILKDIYIEIDREVYLSDFYSLYFAKDDLSSSDNQWYWAGANRENIDTIITSTSSSGMLYVRTTKEQRPHNTGSFKLCPGNLNLVPSLFLTILVSARQVTAV